MSMRAARWLQYRQCPDYRKREKKIVSVRSFTDLSLDGISHSTLHTQFNLSLLIGISTQSSPNGFWSQKCPLCVSKINKKILCSIKIQYENKEMLGRKLASEWRPWWKNSDSIRSYMLNSVGKKSYSRTDSTFHCPYWQTVAVWVWQSDRMRCVAAQSIKQFALLAIIFT